MARSLLFLLAYFWYLSLLLPLIPIFIGVRVGKKRGVAIGICVGIGGLVVLGLALKGIAVAAWYGTF